MINRTVRLIGLFAMVAMLLAGAAAAQNGGQLWVRLYHDQNGDGQRNSGEPLLTRGAAVALRDGSGVIIATALLDESPNSEQGLIGFQGLPPGSYTTVVTSADFTTTGEATFTREVAADGVPVVVEIGAQPILDAPAALSEVRGLFGLPIYLGERTQVARVALGIVGAAIVAAFMTLLGTATYWFVLRRSQHGPHWVSPPSTTTSRIPRVPGP